jgi:4-amino-4-deoxy-L-arabinose transferase-like glycosyltransferase
MMNYFKTHILPSRTKTLLTVLLFSFLVRLVFVLILKPDGFYFSDTRHYDNAALHLLSGDGFGEKYNRSPVYPVYMALIYAVFGHSFVAVRFVESLLGVFLVWLIYHIARKAFDDKVALLSALIASLFPHFILLTGILYSTNLFTVFLACSAYFMIKSEERDFMRYIILSGMCAGLATLTIPAMFFILPFWLLWLMVRTQRTAQFNFVKTIAFSAIIIATLAPWTIRNYQKYDRLTLVRPVPHTAFPNLDDLDAQKKRIDSGFADTSDYLKAHPNGSENDKIGNIIGNYFKHPVQSAKYMLSELGHFWALYPDRLDTPSQDYQKKIQAKDQRLVSLKGTLWDIAVIASISIMLPVFLFALFGLISSRPVERPKLLLVLTILAMSMGYSLIYAEVRYRIPIEPYVIIFMAAGIINLVDGLRSIKVKRQLKKQQVELERHTLPFQPNWGNNLPRTEDFK